METWKSIANYEEYYNISTDGRVFSFPRKGSSKKGIFLKQTIGSTGYYQVSLCKDGKAKKLKVHQLVAKTFIKKPEGADRVNHKDHNPLNNNVSNLEWCNNMENVRYRRPIKYKYKGVYKLKGCKSSYHAQINYNGKTIHLGTYKTEDEAAIAYNNLSKELHGKFAYLNKICDNILS